MYTLIMCPNDHDHGLMIEPCKYLPATSWYACAAAVP